jgi:hypothetical protein
MMASANTEPELRDWLRWAAEDGNLPAFVRKLAEAALLASMPDYVLLRPVLVELKRWYPLESGASHSVTSRFGPGP